MTPKIQQLKFNNRYGTMKKGGHEEAFKDGTGPIITDSKINIHFLAYLPLGAKNPFAL